MTEADILYRVFGELFKNVAAETSSLKSVDAVAKAPDPESVTVTHKICHVETDWISAIEKGLVFIGKAIEENRQFIRADGEVKPIEKVKHVSKESVQHLSRHSDLITREQTDDDIIPDKLYTVEKESDYAVYENKFLYLLLTKIREFVEVRYNAIVAAYREYRGRLEANKAVRTSTRRLNFTLSLTDEQDDVAFSPTGDDCVKAIARMDNIMQSVAFYMRTPIIQEASRAAKITTVTKTNVLLKDKNFFGALQLYEFLLAYEGDGYTIEGRVDTPELSEQTVRELAVPALLTAFLVYEHGMGVEDYLRQEFEKEELRRAEEAQKELQRRLKAMKSRIERTGKSEDEYILMLEERNAILENSYSLLQEALQREEELNAQIALLGSEIEILNEEIAKLEEEKRQLIEEMERREEEHKRQIEELNRQHAEEIEALNAAHAEEIEALKAAHAEEIAVMQLAHEEEVAALKDEYETEIAALRQQAQEQIAKLKEAHKEAMDKLRADSEAEIAEVRQRAQDHYALLKKQSDEQIAKLKDAHKADTDRLAAAYEAKAEGIKADYEHRLALLRTELDNKVAEGASREKESRNRLKESEGRAQTALRQLGELQNELKFTVSERDVLKARLTAVRKEYGLLTAADDFTTEEGFNALEHEYEVLGRLLTDEWKNVKAQLRKEFSESIISSMRKKKPKKSKEYDELKKFVDDRRNSGMALTRAAEDIGASVAAGEGALSDETEEDVLVEVTEESGEADMPESAAIPESADIPEMEDKSETPERADTPQTENVQAAAETPAADTQTEDIAREADQPAPGGKAKRAALKKIGE